MYKAYVFSDVFCLALVCVRASCPIGGKSIYSLSIQFVDTITGTAKAVLFHDDF